MRRHILFAALALLTACAKKEQPADTTSAAPAAATPAPIALADVAGTWEGKVMPMDRDTVLTTFVNTATATMDGWNTKLPNGVTAAAKVVSVAGDSIVTEAGPFASVLRKGQQVSIRQVGRLRDGKLVGTLHAKYANGDTATLRFESTRKAP